MFPRLFSTRAIAYPRNRSLRKHADARVRPVVEALEQRLVLDNQPNGLPILHSMPGAHTAIYLDFEGYGSNRPYDEDGDPSTFNATEQAHITEAWRQVTSYFSMFDVDVTTIHPTVPFAWDLISNSISGGYSYVGAFPNSQPRSFNESSDARSRVSGIAHELGHNFGLNHQSDYDLQGNKTHEYSSGYDALHGPIMGVDYAQRVHKWFLGHPATSPSAIQADVDVIASKIKRYEPAGGDGLRPHTNGGTIDTAVPLDVHGAIQSAQGVIARLTDKDAYSFTTNGGIVTVDAVPPAPSGLAIKLEVYRGDGTLLASADGGSANDQHLTLNLPADTYYVFVSSHGDYGDLGQYNLSVRDLPLGWRSQDIGSVGVAGSAGSDFGAGSITVSGAGADIWGTSDAFRYAYQALTGDGSVTARVVSQDNTDGWAKAGVMIRDSLAANARHAMMVVSPANGVAFQYRTATGGSSAGSSRTGPRAPYYVRITREGNSLTGYDSPDGVNWTREGSVDIALGSTVFVGLAVTSHNSGRINNSTFDSVSFEGSIVLPPGWSSQDVGAVGLPGNAGSDGSGAFLVSGSGARIGRGHDQFRYVFQTLTGEGSIVARITANEATAPWSKAGVMIRSDLSPGATSILMGFGGGKGLPDFQYWVQGGSAYGVFKGLDGADMIPTPYWVRLTRSGDTFSGDYSTDGVDWTEQGTVDLSPYATLNGTLYIGLAVTSRDNSQLNHAAFDMVSATGLLGPVTGTYNTLPIPDGLQLSLGTGTGITLHWNDVSGNTGYAVERSGDGATWTQIGTTGAGVTTYQDNNPAGSHRYYYRVSARDDAGRSAPSVAANLVNRPSAPFNVTVTSWTTSQLIINWRDVSGDTGYRIERSTDGVTFTAVGTVGTNVTSFTNGGLSAGTRYYYRVIARSALGDSPNSAVASNTTRGTSPGNGSAGEAPADAVGPVQFAVALPATVTAEADILFRASAAPDASLVDVLATPGNGVAFPWRAAFSGQVTTIRATGLSVPRDEDERLATAIAGETWRISLLDSRPGDAEVAPAAWERLLAEDGAEPFSPWRIKY
jgi:hypothetical protein